MKTKSAALLHLEQLKLAYKRDRYDVPEFALPKPKYNTSTTNGLTVAIVDFLKLSGGFASRLSSTGTYRADQGGFVPSQQRKGLPDVFAVVGGMPVFVEIKGTKGDRLSQDQKEVIAELQEAGALTFVAKTFEEFYAWYMAEIQPRIPHALT